MKRTFSLIVAMTMLFVSPVFAALKANDTAPTFTLRDLSGKDFYLSDVVGPGSKEKANGIIISFFASWCVSCRRELPLFDALNDELNGKGVKIVLINLREDAETIEQLMKELNVSKPIILSDVYGKASEKYQVRFLPETFIINKDGKIADVVFGEIEDRNKVRAIVEKMLK